jgi:hypothetical protein
MMENTIFNPFRSEANSLRRLLWWAGGAIPSMLVNCPTEQMKYTAIGVMMFFMALLASVSFAFFLSFSFEVSPIFAWLGGFMWGCLMFNLERAVLTSFRKGETGLVSIGLRLLLILSISFVIGEPLLLQLFHKEINLELIQKGRMVVTNARQEITARYQEEIDSLLNANREIQNRLDELENDRRNKEQVVISEIEGTVGTGKRGEGPAAKQKNKAFQEAVAKLNEYKSETTPTLSQNNLRLAEIRSEIETQTRLTENADQNGDGILARHKSFISICLQNPSVALVGLFVFLILSLVDVLPFSFKVFGKKGVYDEMLETAEKSQIEKIRETKVLEKAQSVRLRELQKNITEKIFRAVANGKTNTLSDEDEIRLAALLKTIIFQKSENEIMRRNSNLINETEFADTISVEIIGHEDLQISLQVPGNSRRTISLKSISGDIQRIAASVGEKLRLAKAFSSSRREISVSLPLLPQLEKDFKMLLLFEEIGET